MLPEVRKGEDWRPFCAFGREFKKNPGRNQFQQQTSMKTRASASGNRAISAVDQAPPFADCWLLGAAAIARESP